jgi:hypothetical protein
LGEKETKTMSKKHFETIACVLAKNSDSKARESLTKDMITFLETTNPRFNPFRFIEAVETLAIGQRPSGFSKSTFDHYFVVSQAV